MTSAAEGGGGLKMLTIADKGGGGKKYLNFGKKIKIKRAYHYA